MQLKINSFYGGKVMKTNNEKNTFKRISQNVVLCTSFIVMSIWGLYSLIFTTDDNYNRNISIIIFVVIAVVALVLLIVAVLIPGSFKYQVFVLGEYLHIEDFYNHEKEAFKISSLKVEKKGRKINLSDGRKSKKYYWNAKLLIFLNSITKNEDTVEETEHIP